MRKYNLYLIARQLVTRGRGILASDERTSSLTKKFEGLGIKSTEETRRRYRELFVTAPDIEKYINGMIMFDETIRQSDSAGTLFTDILEERGILTGIKVDEGTEPLMENSGESIAIGLAGLEDRLDEYFSLGARFTKWRSVITIDKEKGYPTEKCINDNSVVMAKYALLAQSAGLVPIVEPEIIMDGNHSIEETEEVLTRTLVTLFRHLENENVDLKATILKSGMVLPGSQNPAVYKPEEIAARTIKALKFSVPHDIPGIIFLSGGQDPYEATVNLDAIAKKEPLPWEITFSYLRAAEQPALETWKGIEQNFETAQQVFANRLKMLSLADQGLYSGQ